MTSAPPKDKPRRRYRQAINVVLAELCTDPQRGLTESEAAARLGTYGINQLAGDAPVPGWRKFLTQFQDVLVLLLLAAAGVSTGLWVYERDSAWPYEAVAILAVVLLNAVMGYIQEARAEHAVAALRHMSAPLAKVVRDGKRQSVPAHSLVPGDIILVEEGDTIPADARLIESVALQTAEAALTGESLPVVKEVLPIQEDAGIGDQVNMLFSGTVTLYGHGRAVVTETGMQTQMGRIAGMLKEAPTETTPLQKELAHVGKLLGMTVIAIAVLMIGMILLVEEVHGLSAFFEVLILGVALAVAAVPEGLPAVVTAVLSLGVQRMAVKHAIVRHLAAVETLGSANVIASDKTGTLTKNQMTVRVIVAASGRVNIDGAGYEPQGRIRPVDGEAIEGPLRAEVEQALMAGYRASNAVVQQCDGRWVVHGNPTEGALVVAAQKAGLKESTLQARFVRVREVPFSSERKVMTTVQTDRDHPDCLLVCTKGAPDVVLTRCRYEQVGEDRRLLTEERRQQIAECNDKLAGEALRTLGVAARSLPRDTLRSDATEDTVEQDLTFLALIGMIDPPREEAKAAVSRAKGAGIRPLMITGDHPTTATIIARELGINSDKRAATGSELEQMSDAMLDRTVQDVSVYARVNPEHKLRIVKALQRHGMTVAMTGDGVNDAPALKTADIGVAMGISGTDVSKEAADMVLADDNFATIVAAVEEGRAIFANIRKFLRYLLSSNLGEVMTMFFGVLLADMLGLVPSSGSMLLSPLLATQILWINLVTDGAPALALGIDPADASLMAQPPRPRREGVITRTMWGGIVFVGAVMAISTLGVLDASLPGGFIEGTGTVTYAQTMAFTTLMLCQLFNVFNARSDERSAFSGLFTNHWLWAAVAFSVVLHIAVIYVPFLQQAFSTVSLSVTDWLYCVLVASAVLWFREGSKLVLRAANRKQLLT